MHAEALAYIIYTLNTVVQGVQDQNLPKEIGITKKLCTSDP